MTHNDLYLYPFTQRGDKIIKVYRMPIFSEPYVVEPSEIKRFWRRSSSTRHSTPRKRAISDSSVEHTPRENSKQSTFYIQNPIMSTSFQYLVHFIQQELLEIIYYNTKVQSAIIKQRNKNKYLAKMIQGSVCAHQKNPPHKRYSSSCTYNRGKIKS